MILGRRSSVPDACLLTFVGTTMNEARPTANEEGPIDKEQQADQFLDDYENGDAERWILSSKSNTTGKKCIKLPMERSGIKLLLLICVRKAYKRKKENGLISLLFKGAIKWTLINWRQLSLLFLLLRSVTRA